jgi:hypothetical protein
MPILFKVEPNPSVKFKIMVLASMPDRIPMRIAASNKVKKGCKFHLVTAITIKIIMIMRKKNVSI